MSLWKFREKGHRDQVQEVCGSVLLPMIQQGILDDQHEVLPPDSFEWLSPQQAVEVMRQSGIESPVQGAASASKDTGYRGSEPPRSSDERPVTGQTASGAVPPSAFFTSRGSARREVPIDDDDNIDMTPMIDMTFLLLVFFMVSMAVAPAWRQVSLPPATSGDTQDPENRVVLVLEFSSEVDKDALDSMNGSQYTTLADAQIHFADVSGDSQNLSQQSVSPDTLPEQLKQAFLDKPAAQFILVAHRKMPVGVVREVLKQAKQAGAKETLVGVSMPN